MARPPKCQRQPAHHPKAGNFEIKLVFFIANCYLMTVNFKPTSVYVLGGLMLLATSLRALTDTAPAPKTVALVTNSTSNTSDAAADSSNPYAVITDRNIFRLNPPPPPKDPNEKPVELPKVYLNGIVKIGDNVEVLFSIPPKDSKKTTSYFSLAPGEMAPGQNDETLELVNIHPDQQEVDIVVNGTAMTLSVASNSLAPASGETRERGKSTGGPAPAPPPAATASASSGSSAIIVGGGQSSDNGGGSSVSIIGGSSSSSSPVQTASANTGANASGYGGGPNYGGNGVTISGAGQATPTASTTSTQPVSIEQQYANMIIYQAQHAAQAAQSGQNIPPIPLPPAVQQAANELEGNTGGSGGSYTPPPPPSPP